MNNNVAISTALIRRDLLLLKRNIRTTLIDNCILAVSMSLITGKLFPLLGMPASFVPPFFAGSATLLVVIAYNFIKAFRLSYSIAHEDGGMMSYHLTLPLPTRWLFATYIVSSVIELFIIVIPTLLLTLFLLRADLLSAFTLAPINLLQFVGIHLLGNFCLTTLFLALSLVCTFDWFHDNAWPRIFSPLFFFSPNVYTWSALVKFSPLVGYLVLINPLTYIIEGPRTALLGGNEYLPLMLCAVALISITAGNCLLLKIGIQKQLDPVWR